MVRICNNSSGSPFENYQVKSNFLYVSTVYQLIKLDDQKIILCILIEIEKKSPLTGDKTIDNTDAVT